MENIVIAKSQEITASSFASSPLISPERLREKFEEAFYLAPPWAQVWSPAGPETLPGEAEMVVRVGDKHPDQYSLTAVSLAILFELTRFGNSVTTNTNGKAGSKSAQHYLKLTFRHAPKDNMPVSRIIAGAGPHQAVATNNEFPRNLHPDGLTTVGAGKPAKNARAVAMGHAERRARDQLCAEAEVRAYLDNLGALFAFHDELFAITPD